tara:strand:+ start:1528 stop:1653 length:126 start_codon:yes stop_codon:yes gene_type:complete
LATYPVKHKETGEQKEHMDIANSCKAIFKEQFPVIAEALDW